ncbi:MAG TPA: tetratricopeptide repeat protein [Myxococcota bacterium]|jgi:hypothetical protein|nr:tetratricopeptide repeat protein [Myxococcota bacterium]
MQCPKCGSEFLSTGALKNLKGRDTCPECSTILQIGENERAGDAALRSSIGAVVHEAFPPVGQALKPAVRVPSPPPPPPPSAPLAAPGGRSAVSGGLELAAERGGSTPRLKPRAAAAYGVSASSSLPAFGELDDRDQLPAPSPSGAVRLRAAAPPAAPGVGGAGHDAVTSAPPPAPTPSPRAAAEPAPEKAIEEDLSALAASSRPPLRTAGVTGPHRAQTLAAPAAASAATAAAVAASSSPSSSAAASAASRPSSSDLITPIPGAAPSPAAAMADAGATGRRRVATVTVARSSGGGLLGLLGRRGVQIGVTAVLGTAVAAAIFHAAFLRGGSASGGEEDGRALFAVASEARAHMKEAVAAKNKGDSEAAAAAYEAALRADPGLADAAREAGLLRAALGDDAAAVRLLRRYLDLRPTAPDRAAVDEALDRLE